MRLSHCTFGTTSMVTLESPSYRFRHCTSPLLYCLDRRFMGCNIFSYTIGVYREREHLDLIFSYPKEAFNGHYLTESVLSVRELSIVNPQRS